MNPRMRTSRPLERERERERAAATRRDPSLAPLASPPPPPSSGPALTPGFRRPSTPCSDCPARRRPCARARERAVSGGLP